MSGYIEKYPLTFVQRTGIAGCIGLLSITAGGMAGTSEPFETTAVTQHTATPDIQLQSDDEASVATVANLIDNPAILRSDKFMFQPDLVKHNGPRLMSKVQMQHELGLIYYDGYQFMHDKQLDKPGHASDEFIAAAGEFAAQYDVSIGYAHPDTVPYVTELTPTELESYKVVDAAHAIVTGLDRLAVQDVDDSGLKTILLGAFKPQFQGGGMALGKVASDTIIINIAAQSPYFTEDVVEHEQGHLQSLHNGLGETADLTELNGGDIYTGRADNQDSPLSLESFNQKYATTDTCKSSVEVAADRAKLTVATDYSLKDAEEDYTELRMEVTHGNPDIYNPSSPKLRQKALTILADIYQRRPSLGRYLAFLTSSNKSRASDC